MDVTAFYVDERNAITQPDRMVFVSQYFRRNWMARLGPTGTAIVLYLRGACYHNRKSGETRDTVQIAQRQIAAGCGCSVATLKREIEHNEALRRFVQVSQEWERDGATGRVRQVENVYKVAMDDPLTEADEVRLKQIIEERITRERQRTELVGIARKVIRTTNTASSIAVETACSDTGSTPYSKAVSTACSTSVDTARSSAGRSIDGVPGAHSELLRPGAQNELTPLQNELPLKNSLHKITKRQTLNVGGECIDNNQTPDRTSILDSDDEAVCTIVALTGDAKSTRRFAQLREICADHGKIGCWTEALRSTERAIKRDTVEPQKRGAYFCAAIVRQLERKGITVPSGTPQERDEVHGLIAASLSSSTQTAANA